MTYHFSAEGLDPQKLMGQGLFSAPIAWEAPTVDDLASQFPGLQIIALAGRGGMGAVYEARQLQLNRRVAVKILPPQAGRDPLARQRFEREARLLATLDHPSVIKIFDFGELPNGLLYMVMEWADGGTLKTILSKGPLPAKDVWQKTKAIAEGLKQAHRLGIIHRDLKPSNVLLTAQGEVKLGDFGLAWPNHPDSATRLTLTGVAFGTPDYMAPEQLEGKAAVSPATDVYSLGVIVYSMLTGKLPQGAFPPASATSPIPSEMNDVLSRALATDPENRYASIEAFQNALEQALHATSRKANQRVLFSMLGLGLLGLGLLWGALRFFSPNPGDESLASQESPHGESKDAWRSLLDTSDPEFDARGGGTWKREGRALVSGEGRCLLKLSADPHSLLALENGYDLRASFTRLEGQYSVIFLLPTQAGPCSLSFDAWDEHLGGIQNINGQDIRTHGQHFFSKLTNGVRQEVLIQVRRESITVYWNGRLAKSWSLQDLELSINPLFQTPRPALPSVGSWSSPTRFHRVEVRPGED